MTIHNGRMPLAPDDARTLTTLEAIVSAPTVPYHEARALEAIRAQIEALGIATRWDRYGQLHARLQRGEAKRALVLMAHTDHPGFVVSEADGVEGRARVSGGLRARCFGRPFPVQVHDDLGSPAIRAVIDDYRADHQPLHNSPGDVRITAEGPLRRGQWAVLDLPGLEVRGDELRMRAADDLAGCALIVLALDLLRSEQRPFDVHVAFTRAEETGLFGARLLAEDGLLPRDAYVVSLEASNATFAPAGDGIVVRVGDLHNTFSNEAERYLRVAQHRLTAAGIPVQRKLLAGGTCEASAFVRLGWTATGLALPNVGYHNDHADGTFGPEIVRLGDVRSGVALVSEAACAAGADESEDWWPAVRQVPDEVRRLLADTPGRLPAPENGRG